MRLRALALMMAVFVSACGGSAQHEMKKPLLRGRDVYTLRYNPASCLINQSDFAFEIVSDLGFERVYLVEPEMEEELMEALAREPGGLAAGSIDVDARLINTSLPYGNEHYARGLKIYAVGVEAELDED